MYEMRFSALGRVTRSIKICSPKKKKKKKRKKKKRKKEKKNGFV
jgi:hypothetical protein